MFGDAVGKRAIFHRAAHYRVNVRLLWRGELFSNTCRTGKYARTQAYIAPRLESLAIDASLEMGVCMKVAEGGIAQTTTTTIQRFRHANNPEGRFPPFKIVPGPAISLNQQYSCPYLNRVTKHGWSAGGCEECSSMSKKKCKKCGSKANGGCVFFKIGTPAVETCKSLLGDDGNVDLEPANQNQRDTYYKSNPGAQAEFDACNGYKHADCYSHPLCGRLKGLAIAGCRSVTYWLSSFSTDETIWKSDCHRNRPGYKWLEYQGGKGGRGNQKDVTGKHGNGVCLGLSPAVMEMPGQHRRRKRDQRPLKDPNARWNKEK